MEISELYKRMFFASLAFILVLLVGTIGYMYIGGEQTTWIDGLYMTVITVSTIGFGEVVDLTNNTAGRFFTIFISLTGIGVMTYLLSNIAALIIEDDLRESLRKRKIKKTILKQEEHYIICGLGRVGSRIADELAKTGRPFVCTDLSTEKMEELREIHPLALTIAGDCTDEAFLKELGLENALGFFIATGDDNINLVVTLTAKQLNPNVRIIASCKDSGYFKKLYSVGADKVISPNFIGGLRMASEMLRPTVTTFLDEMLRDQKLNLRIEEIKLAKRYTGLQIKDLNLSAFRSSLLMAVNKEGNWAFNPHQDYVLSSGEVLILMTNPEERVALETKFSKGL